jgi:hypothetical protein
LKNHCFLLVFKDNLFKQIILSLLKEMNNVEMKDSTANDVEGLLKEVLKYQPDTVLLEESSPLSAAPCLFHLLNILHGRPVVLVSPKSNLMHVVHWRTIEVETASDLFKSITLV